MPDYTVVVDRFSTPVDDTAATQEYLKGETVTLTGADETRAVELGAVRPVGDDTSAHKRSRDPIESDKSGWPSGGDPGTLALRPLDQEVPALTAHAIAQMSVDQLLGYMTVHRSEVDDIKAIEAAGRGRSEIADF